MEPPGKGDEMAAALRAAKQALRGELRQRLRALGAEEKQRQSLLLSRKVLGHPKYKESRRIAIFLSMPDEIQTEEIIQDIFKQGKECFIPRYKPQSNHMDMLKLLSAEDISSLALTSWNILQPSDDDSAREEALAGGGLDLIFMPGLGFDKKGNRLGRGKGYYDTYLERCMKHPRGKPYTIALAFREQICESVPVAANDVQVDEILYEDC
ncbi:5-formyltetrahydrofolate cyclo-ligase [Indicator indicator]|uniref:5-formyltetrahydrofolate cyclo-ligase n=1 Tax=Indicator indicator TaxID=1002788 RepID=UPI0023E039D4|nr:5-formyltetrahydrofolate cyclo-ligase [Indicator indicator]